MSMFRKALTLDDYEFKSLPITERRSFWDVTSVWTGSVFTPSQLMVGGMVGFGLMFWDMVWAIIIAAVVLVVICALCGSIGQKTGATYGLATWYTFGSVGQYIPSLLLASTLVYWIAFDITWAPMFAEAGFGASFVVMCIILGLVYMTTAYIGFDGLKWLSRIGVPLLLGLMVYVIVRAVIVPGAWAEIVTRVPSEPIPFAVGLAVIIGGWIGGAIEGAYDIQRFSKSTAESIHASWLGMGIGRSVVVFCGAMAAIAFGTWHLGEVFAQLGVAVIGFITILILAWTTADNTAYQASLTLAAPTRIRKKIWVLIIFAFGISMAIWGVLGTLMNFMLTMGAVIPPLGGVLIADFYVVNKMRYPDISKIYTRGVKTGEIRVRKWRISPLVAWAVGAALAWYWVSSDVALGAVYGLLVAFVLYILLEMVIKQPLVIGEEKKD